MFKMNSQQGPTVRYSWILLNLMWQPGRKWDLGENGYMYVYDWAPKTITTLLTGYTPIQNKKLKKKKKQRAQDYRPKKIKASHVSVDV